MRYNVQGSADVKKALQELERKAATKVLTPSLRDGAKTVIAPMKALAPEETGAMKAAIKVRAGKRKKGKLSVMVSIGKKWFRGAVFYAGFVVFGHKQGSRKLGAARKDIPANNFPDKAFEAHRQEALKTIEEGIARRLDETVREVKK